MRVIITVSRKYDLAAVSSSIESLGSSVYKTYNRFHLLLVDTNEVSILDLEKICGVTNVQKLNIYKAS